MGRPERLDGPWEACNNLGQEPGESWIRLTREETSIVTTFNRRTGLGLFLVLGTLAFSGASTAVAATASALNASGKAALDRLLAANPKAQRSMKDAKAVLVFPRIIKAGFMIGGQSGDGVLFRNGKAIAYYNISAGSFGLQAGGQAFSYALFFMNEKALDYLTKSNGWAIGSGPSVVVVDKGKAMSSNTTTLTQDVYAFPFGQGGLMAGMGIEGSKITPIHPK